jgi:hypothetical protein
MGEAMRCCFRNVIPKESTLHKHFSVFTPQTDTMKIITPANTENDELIVISSRHQTNLSAKADIHQSFLTWHQPISAIQHTALVMKTLIEELEVTGDWMAYVILACHAIHPSFSRKCVTYFINWVFRKLPPWLQEMLAQFPADFLTKVDRLLFKQLLPKEKRSPRSQLLGCSPETTFEPEDGKQIMTFLKDHVTRFVNENIPFTVSTVARLLFFYCMGSNNPKEEMNHDTQMALYSNPMSTEEMTRIMYIVKECCGYTCEMAMNPYTLQYSFAMFSPCEEKELAEALEVGVDRITDSGLLVETSSKDPCHSTHETGQHTEHARFKYTYIFWITRYFWFLRATCACCGRQESINDMPHCGRCHYTRYCDAACQRLDWKWKHRRETCDQVSKEVAQYAQTIFTSTDNSMETLLLHNTLTKETILKLSSESGSSKPHIFIET